MNKIKSDTIPQWEDGAQDNEARKMAERVWKLFRKHHVIGPLLAKDKRTGVVLCTASVEHPKVKYKTVIGTVTPEKGQVYDFHSGEKIDRLCLHPDDAGSSQSRGKDQFAGAIRGHKYFWSISGLRPDDYDELMAVLVAFGRGDLSKAGAYDLLSVQTKNPHARLFFNLADDLERQLAA